MNFLKLFLWVERLHLLYIVFVVFLVHRFYNGKAISISPCLHSDTGVPFLELIGVFVKCLAKTLIKVIFFF